MSKEWAHKLQTRRKYFQMSNLIKDLSRIQRTLKTQPQENNPIKKWTKDFNRHLTEEDNCHYCSVTKLSPTLQPHGLWHPRLLCLPLPLNSCPLSQWCHPDISSSVALFSFCFQFFPALGSIPTSWLFAPDSQSTGASASVLPMNIQDWFPLGWTSWISL